MSSNNNNEVNGLIFIMAMLVAGAILLGVVIYIVIATITLGLSIISLFALWKPLKLGKETITPQEARWFLIRGIIGFYVFPLFVSVLANIMKWRIEADWSIHIMIVGYIIGSLGIEFVLAKLNEEDEEPSKGNVTVIAPPQPQQEPPRATFEYARWDDDEGKQ